MVISQTRQVRSLFPDGRLHPNIVKQIGMLTDDESRAFSVENALGLARELVPHIQNKALMLSVPYPGTAFLIGDSPVAMYNPLKSEHYGNLGVAVPGIEIHMPLSATVMLSCLDTRMAAFVAQKSLPLRRSLTTGARHALTVENMTHYNSLQVRWAERQLVSSTGDFDLVRRMIADNPEFRHGIRLTVQRGREYLRELADWQPRVVVPEGASSLVDMPNLGTPDQPPPAPGSRGLP